LLSKLEKKKGGKFDSKRESRVNAKDQDKKPLG